VRPDPNRYDKVASALHWLIGIALLAQITFGLLLDEIAPRGTPSRGAVINLHKSVGIVLGIAIVLRLAWRWRHRPPAWPASMPAWQQRAARLGHAALYTCMAVLPVSGYIASNFSKRGVNFFGRALPPWGPDMPGVYSAFNLVHVVTGWALAVLVAGHVLVALKHALIDHDAVFARIWPWAAGRDAAHTAPDTPSRRST
jgi:cytochrome b561